MTTTGPKSLHLEMHTAFAMWRKTMNELRRYWLLGYMPDDAYTQRLEYMGYLPHEVKAEMDYGKEYKAQILEASE